MLAAAGAPSSSLWPLTTASGLQTGRQVLNQLPIPWHASASTKQPKSVERRVEVQVVALTKLLALGLAGQGATYFGQSWGSGLPQPRCMTTWGQPCLTVRRKRLGVFCAERGLGEQRLF